MSEKKEMTGEVYYPAPEIVSSAHVPDYEAMHEEATRDLPGFWGKIAAENFEWYKPWNQVLDDSNAPFYKWFVIMLVTFHTTNLGIQITK